MYTNALIGGDILVTLSHRNLRAKHLSLFMWLTAMGKGETGPDYRVDLLVYVCEIFGNEIVKLY